MPALNTTSFKWIFHGLNGVGTALHLAGMIWMARDMWVALNPIAVWLVAPALILVLLSKWTWGRLFLSILIWGATTVCLSGLFLVSHLWFGPSDPQDGLILLVLPFLQGLATLAGGICIYLMSYLFTRLKS